jgi:two-component system nitrogen regulation response regulator GlnG
VIKRALILSAGPAILPEDLSLAMGQRLEVPRDEDPTLETVLERRLSGLLKRIGEAKMEGLYDMVLTQVERPLFKLVLAATKGNQVKAARVLGINRNTLAKKLVSLGLKKQE